VSVSGEGVARVTAVITVHKYEPAAYEEPAAGPVLTRIHVEESFSGGIEGDGVAEFLQAGRADGSASLPGWSASPASWPARRARLCYRMRAPWRTTS
jgi:uncharacterized protein DUF3224